jgi:hypothetical protein
MRRLRMRSGIQLGRILIPYFINMVIHWHHALASWEAEDRPFGPQLPTLLTHNLMNPLLGTVSGVPLSHVVVGHFKYVLL